MAGCAIRMLAPAFAKLQEDPLGMVERIQEARQSPLLLQEGLGMPNLGSPYAGAAADPHEGEWDFLGMLQTMLEAAVPGVPFDVYLKASLCLAAAAVLVVPA